MIDQNLISANISSVTDSFAKKKKISEELYVLEDFLTLDARTKLNEYILNQDAKPWDLETTSSYIKMDVPRRKISWHAESIIEELHEVMSSLTPYVEQITGSKRQFHGIVLWEDRGGYRIDWHTDNPILMATLQIYIAGSSDNPGTEFKIGNHQTHVCDFFPNSGYFINQSVVRPEHRTVRAVPDFNLRYSLFGMWK